MKIRFAIGLIMAGASLYVAYENKALLERILTRLEAQQAHSAQ
jgi:hypothetical protein